MKRLSVPGNSTANPNVTLHHATESDLDFISRLDSVCFNIPDQEAKTFNKEIWDNGSEATFIIKLKGKKPEK
ncbi:hypothetical protein [Cytobacillus sp. NCCP-133]|uniref:hypothetical protein n=1 Tax=Cytobacillus sp. NCCP-133 TaxID=766848 RepID=UPI0022319C65|nr:hypothetical protein [Cytobacillus sp. NCCP-133]GLB61105.1 hypothetical protein NCCP133_32350 [Cytobacillus sp. NCCP-133]